MTEFSDLDFTTEAKDILERIQTTLESQGFKASESINALYREVHTLKGSAMLFGYAELSTLLHVLETSFDPLKKEKCKITNFYEQKVEQCFDVITEYVNNINSNSPQYKQNLSQMVPEIIEATVDMLNAKIEGGKIKEHAVPSYIENQNTLKDEYLISHTAETIPVEPEIQIAISEAHVAQPIINQESKPMKNQEPSKEQESPKDSNQSESSSIRVSVGVLDSLMSLAGEMVLVRNQVLQFASTTDDFNFMNLSQRLDVVTTELQGEVMKTRMQPIGNILTKFTRTVRDISRELNKKIDLQLEGVDTELDKTLIEIIKDPLTHIIRNACDHGIELPEERVAKGKKETGLVKIRSYYEGGQVIVEISDDGKGLDKDKLIKKAIEKGILTQEKTSQMSEKEIYGIIFLPGFSTAAQVTNLSGRGVGMDVVKTNIEKIGGSVDISSKINEGITIKLKIPLTLAIVPAMIVRSNNELYAIPQVKLKELVRIENSQHIEYVHNKPVYRLRGKILPLVNLKEILKTASQTESTTTIAVLQSDQDTFGLMVDEVLDKVDIVVKPLARFLKGLNIYAGATVLGDGSLAVILDVNGLAQRALSEHKSTAHLDEETQTNNRARKTEYLTEYMTFKVGNHQRLCIPLDFVYRLEEIKTSTIDMTNETPLVNYRGNILPLCFVSGLLGPKEIPQIENLNTIVIKSGEKIFGLVVEDIRDIVQPLSCTEPSTDQNSAIEGSFLHNDQIYSVLNMSKILDKMIPKERVTQTTNNRNRILYVEDSPTFRKHVSHFLTQAGYKVKTAENGKEGLNCLESEAGKIDIILSDIEMPEMNGLEFAKNVRKNSQYNTIPLIALTTLFQEQNIKNGKDAGFDFYLEKLDETKILTTLTQAAEMKRSA